jgi:hypothetical protein
MMAKTVFFRLFVRQPNRLYQRFADKGAKLAITKISYFSSKKNLPNTLLGLPAVRPTHF